MTVKKLVHHNKGLETTIHKERIEDTKQQLEDNGKEKIEIANNISKLQSTVGVALNQLNQPTLDTESPVLTPSGGSTNSSPKPTPSLASVTTFFKTKIDEMKKMKMLKLPLMICWRSVLKLPTQKHVLILLVNYLRKCHALGQYRFKLCNVCCKLLSNMG